MPDWSVTQPLPSHWQIPIAGFDSAGGVLVGYGQVLSYNPVSTRVAIAERQNGACVDVWEKQSQGDVIPIGITVGVGADGTAAACYTAITSADPATFKFRHFVTYAPATTRTWENPTEIVPETAASEYVRQCRVAVSDNGIAAVIADRFDGPATGQAGSVVITFHAPGSAWTTPQKLNPVDGLNGSAQLGIDAFGNATVAWRHRYQNSPERSSVRVATATAAGVQPSVALTPENGTDAFGVVLDVNYSGAAVIGIQLGSQANVTYRDNQSAAWQPLTALFTSTTASSSHCLAVAMTFSGMGYALMWRQGPSNSGNDTIMAARRGSYGFWTNPKQVSVFNAMSFDGHIAVRRGPYDSEDAVLVYTAAVGYGGGDPGLGLFQASHWPAYLSVPQPPVDIAPQGPHHSLEQVCGDNVGGVVVLETVREGTTARCYATAFDATAPDIVEAVVPSTATVGQVVQLRSRVADTWSAIGQVSWDFGDGSPAGIGSTVTHSWPAAGPYTVTLTVTDSEANTATESFAVTVNP